MLELLGVLGLVGCSTDVGTDDAAQEAGSSSTSGPPGSGSTETSGATSSTTAPEAATSEPLATVEPIEAPEVTVAENAFAHGVASGEPTHDAVILWTRLDGISDATPFVWEMTLDDRFDELIATELVTTDLDRDGTIHIDVGDLPAATTLWYRFRAGPQISPTGRTRTLPAPGTTPDRFRIAISSCQLMETGRWAAHRDIAEADVDLVLWLGDYIYEGGGSSDLDGRAHRNGTATTVDGYRDRYRQYREDPALQAAHAAHPWVVLWDDHEVRNDYDASVDPTRRTAGYRAWWEYQPVRLPPPDDQGLRIHRSVLIGDLADLLLVDVRQYADGTTLLGSDQWTWLRAEFDRNAPRWTVLGSPVIVSGLSGPTSGDDPPLPYSWDGYPEERAELAVRLAQRDSVVVSGDLHTGMALDVKAQPLNADSPVTAPEFMAPAISSAFPADLAPLAPLLPLVNPQLRHVDTRNGWLLLEITPDLVTAEYRTVDDVSDPDSVVAPTTTFDVALGDPVARER